MSAEDSKNKKSSFSQGVFSLVRKIPPGRVTTYGEIAKALGNKNLARAVGNALNKNPDIARVPCHRVIRSDGRAGGYAKGTKKKIKLLKKEGVKISPLGKIGNFKKTFFPLAKVAKGSPFVFLNQELSRLKIF